MALWAHSTSSLDGQASDPVPVLSGVPQGSVLGLVQFLIFINDLPDNIRSSVRLSADDCVLFMNTRVYTFTPRWFDLERRPHQLRTVGSRLAIEILCRQISV